MINTTRLSARMDELAISQSELARRVGTSQQTIWKLVNGQSNGSKYLHKIARELQTTAEFLTDETDQSDGHVPDLTLESHEREALELLRELTPGDCAALMHILRRMAEAREADEAAHTLHSPRQDYRGSKAA